MPSWSRDLILLLMKAWGWVEPLVALGGLSELCVSSVCVHVCAHLWVSCQLA